MLWPVPVKLPSPPTTTPSSPTTVSTILSVTLTHHSCLSPLTTPCLFPPSPSLSPSLTTPCLSSLITTPVSLSTIIIPATLTHHSLSLFPPSSSLPLITHHSLSLFPPSPSLSPSLTTPCLSSLTTPCLSSHTLPVSHHTPLPVSHHTPSLSLSTTSSLSLITHHSLSLITHHSLSLFPPHHPCHSHSPTPCLSFTIIIPATHHSPLLSLSTIIIPVTHHSPTPCLFPPSPSLSHSLRLITHHSLSLSTIIIPVTHHSLSLTQSSTVHSDLSYTLLCITHLHHYFLY
ncbi:hypothetical protein Pcinc_009847 [Petrolisthes cinctipes]|uniref:Uncharacterized protein n=1 Tax=Petrolisthes cinctipes TaxID=88211 RepID=A0AAE1G3Y6_PETCI|nr:hypothetical protein Pcinc_009847 [Petrolisthes cinctipes]